jgi:excinuclease UvrABC nuclease subunit
LTKRSKIDGTIYSPYSSKSIKTSWLPEIVKNTILALRDEAHRFAITYHRLKREKANLEAK